MLLGRKERWMSDRSFMHPKLREVMDMMLRTNFSELQEGKYSLQGNDVYYTIMTLETRDRKNTKAEKHEQYIDIHYLLEGTETIGYACDNGMNGVVESNLDSDYVLYENVQGEQFTTLTPGMYVVLYPSDIHRPGLTGSSAEPISQHIRKVVFKVKKEIVQ
ncbi:YhcH/YjgK/YiaL family protein [Paenibacillus sp. GD4]|uniref:YhcH/YjgK/YiaL family protein n=1 Tax=Paenibacillus sp. GD4 TaxID=3068890 RepID=UPI0027965C36|nr:YhcH/YjgK/YiaL family protein [Paenibacillus sp. GD4]MDQ1914792.1 YhcH/YjgK/YiaL family protein [Paenibacillus sp. GD4]